MKAKCDPSCIMCTYQEGFDDGVAQERKRCADIVRRILDAFSDDAFCGLEENIPADEISIALFDIEGKHEEAD